ncbi:hypothetical protein EVAR_34247_1 [Eumeta japonica]|uniref:Uncharacterized protein n=1 Tax=Eumeta variegata TaxID=151549 RepID=A0A4C1S9Q9_EUMVA|nr:hypothetical protein EVAR_34247_1 [Eumeta japonica]
MLKRGSSSTLVRDRNRKEDRVQIKICHSKERGDDLFFDTSTSFYFRRFWRSLSCTTQGTKEMPGKGVLVGIVSSRLKEKLASSPAFRLTTITFREMVAVNPKTV